MLRFSQKALLAVVVWFLRCGSFANNVETLTLPALPCVGSYRTQVFEASERVITLCPRPPCVLTSCHTQDDEQSYFLRTEATISHLRLGKTPKKIVFKEEITVPLKTCRWKHHGCNFSGSRNKVSAHEEMCAHAGGVRCSSCNRRVASSESSSSCDECSQVGIQVGIFIDSLTRYFLLQELLWLQQRKRRHQQLLGNRILHPCSLIFLHFDKNCRALWSHVILHVYPFQMTGIDACE
jgi:hypothetical protein